MGTSRARSLVKGLTLDAGALIALDRGDRRMIALLQLVMEQGRGIRVPAGVVGQAWRGGARQAILARFLRSRQGGLSALDEPPARAAGELCGLAGTADVVDASVVLVARRTGDGILTSDP